MLLENCSWQLKSPLEIGQPQKKWGLSCPVRVPRTFKWLKWMGRRGSRRLVGWFNFEKSGKFIWFSKTPISPLNASTLSSLSFLVGTYSSFLFEAPRSEEGDKRYDNCYGAGHLIVSDGLLQGVHHLVEVALQALRHARHHPLHLGRYVVVIFVTWPVTKTFFSGTHIHFRHNFVHICRLLTSMFASCCCTFSPATCPRLLIVCSSMLSSTAEIRDWKPPPEKNWVTRVSKPPPLMNWVKEIF